MLIFQFVIFISEGHYLSKAQAAIRLDVAHQTIQKWIADGRLPAIKIPGLGYLINTQDLANFERPKMGRPAGETQP